MRTGKLDPYTDLFETSKTRYLRYRQLRRKILAMPSDADDTRHAGGMVQDSEQES